MNQTLMSDEHVRLRAIDLEDLDMLYEVENDPSLWELGNTTTPYSRFTLKQYIKNSQHDLFADKQLRLMIVCRKDNRVTGIIDLYDFVPLHAHAGVGITILPAFRGKGHASAALSLLCRYAFDFMHLKQLYAHIASDNLPCLNLFTSCGFVQCGLIKEWLRTDNGYKDVVMVQKIGPLP